MAVLDGTVANVALPSIARELGATPAAAVWIVNAYQLVIVATLLPLAALGERLGYRRIYQAGIVVFTLGSLACALSGSLPQLVAARVLQGLGGAAIMSMNGALVRHTYPDSMLGRGIGLNGLVVSVAAAVAPSLASAILAVGPWPWLFAVNVPFGLLNSWLALRYLPRSETSHRPFDRDQRADERRDVRALFHRRRRPRPGGAAWLAAAALAAAVAAGVAARPPQRGRPTPLIPVDLLRIRSSPCRSPPRSAPSWPSDRLRGAALPLPERAWPRPGRDRPPDDALAGGSRALGADRGLSLRPLPGGLLGAFGMALLAVGLGLISFLPAALPVRHRVAHGTLRSGLRPLPGAEQPHDARRDAARRSGAAGGMLGMARLFGMTRRRHVVALVFHLVPARAEAASVPLATAFSLPPGTASLLRLSRRFGRRLFVSSQASCMLAGAIGLEPTTLGFGDRCSTN